MLSNMPRLRVRAISAEWQRGQSIPISCFSVADHADFRRCAANAARPAAALTRTVGPRSGANSRRRENVYTWRALASGVTRSSGATSQCQRIPACGFEIGSPSSRADKCFCTAYAGVAAFTTTYKQLPAKPMTIADKSLDVRVKTEGQSNEKYLPKWYARSLSRGGRTHTSRANRLTDAKKRIGC